MDYSSVIPPARNYVAARDTVECNGRISVVDRLTDPARMGQRWRRKKKDKSVIDPAAAVLYGPRIGLVVATGCSRSARVAAPISC
jgi:hypothetical protein